MSISSNHLNASYLHYRMWSDYYWHAGTLQLPVGNDPSSEVVRSSQPYGYRVLHFDAARLGAMPVIPAPKAGDNERLAWTRITPVAPDMMPGGGNKTYRVTGQYVFYLLKPVWYTDGLPMNKTDVDGDAATANQITANSFSDYLVMPPVPRMDFKPLITSKQI